MVSLDVETGLLLVVTKDCHLVLKNGHIIFYNYEDRQSRVVHLRRAYYLIINELIVSGIYRCVIPTNAVHNDSDPSVGETVSVGIYTGE